MKKVCKLAFSVVFFLSIPIAYSQQPSCDENNDSVSIQRQRFVLPEVVSPLTCDSEFQHRQCVGGELGQWSGTFRFNTCHVVPDTEQNTSKRLIGIDEFIYLGGFRLSAKRTGESPYSTLNSSSGVMAYNPVNHSLFVVGHPYEQGIAEFAIPNINFTDKLEEFELGENVIQGFSEFKNDGRLETEIKNLKVTGMALIDDKLVVNYVDKADMNYRNSETTMVVEDAHDLANSQLSGPYKLGGKLHASGWLSAIPAEWQRQLGGDYLAGSPPQNYIWYDSQGPTAFAFNSTDLNTDLSENIATNKLLGFSPRKILQDKTINKTGASDMDILYNENLHNDLWTVLSSATYGFIVPGTRSYLTLGESGGHQSGIGYGITQNNGRVCGSNCAYDNNDQHAYFWLWDVNELVKVKNGQKKPEKLMPYQHGEFDLPFGSSVTGGAFDPNTGVLYLASASEDVYANGSSNPAFFAYQLSEQVGQHVLNRYCGETLHGDVKVRMRYQADFVEYGEACKIEQQTNLCSNGAFEGWSGSFSATSCQELPDFSAVKDAPLVGIDKFRYKGGFRISSKKYGADVGSSVDFSQGQFTYNPKNHSIFIIGHPQDSAVAEFKVPQIVNSTKIKDFKIADQLVQPFTKFYKTDRVDTGINGYFRVTGMELINGGLMINYINWYDANGSETDTSVYFKDAAHLTSSEIKGPYQLNGAAHAAGWLSAIPEEWQTILGGTHISGSQSGASISSRLSVGPSAFAINPKDEFNERTSGPLNGLGLLDFPLANMLYNKSAYSEFVNRDDILRNLDGKNDLWTNISGAAYGFIIPGTSTYLTVGRSGGHKSGIGYKITQDDGTLCGGSCAYSAKDYASYYWLWDVKELVKVKLGLQNSFDVRPYAYGEFSVPMDLKKAGVNSGYFDPESKLLYLSIPNADETSKYDRPPLMLVYEFVGE